jgi:N-acetylglutamate synthase-like GNAT family acetyltransferase
MITTSTVSVEPAADVRRRPAAAGAEVSIRPAERGDVDAIDRLVAANVGPGMLLPRSSADILRHVSRFLVATRGGEVIGCGELAPLSKTMSEVRSLVVVAAERGGGIGSRLLAAVVAGGRRQGAARVCAFTHVPRAFVAQGFSIVPHTWLPEKIMTDCQACEWFRRCAQHAVVIELGGSRGRGPRRGSP